MPASSHRVGPDVPTLDQDMERAGDTGPWHGDSLLVPSATDLRVHMDRAPAAALLPTAACEGRPSSAAASTQAEDAASC